MAAYLSLADLESAVGTAMVLRLLDDDNTGSANANAVELVLRSAEREVQGYVSGKLDMTAVLGDAEATEHLRSIAVHVAVELAYRRRPEFISRDGTPYHGPYADSVSKLKLIASNKYRIDVNGAPTTPATSGGEITNPVRLGSGGLIVDPLRPGSFTGGFGDF